MMSERTSEDCNKLVTYSTTYVRQISGKTSVKCKALKELDTESYVEQISVQIYMRHMAVRALDIESCKIKRLNIFIDLVSNCHLHI
uniref:Ovule protein n=1 Tax=Schistosoma mansoni TaxID=6183 RepID=A0A5K4F8Z9_SCHMA